jgi:immunoglobulin-binding protein 1
MLHGCLLAWLIAKKPYNKNDRLPSLTQAKAFYLKFFNLTKAYSIHNYKIPTAADESVNYGSPAVLNQASFDKNLLNMAVDRNEKIRRYKEQKEMEKQLELMEIACSRPHVDDEQKREYYMTCIRFWLNRSIEEYKLLLGKLCYQEVS